MAVNTITLIPYIWITYNPNNLWNILFTIKRYVKQHTHISEALFGYGGIWYYFYFLFFALFVYMHNGSIVASKTIIFPLFKRNGVTMSVAFWERGLHWIRKEFEDIKGVIRIRKPKDKQHNGQKKKDQQRSTKHYINIKRSNNTNLTKTWGEQRWSGRVSSSCCTIGTRKSVYCHSFMFWNCLEFYWDSIPLFFSSH